MRTAGKRPWFIYNTFVSSYEIRMPPKKSLSELRLTRKIKKGTRGEYMISIPKRLAELRKLSPGQEVQWKLRQDGKIEVVL